MHDTRWTESEKKQARALFEHALARELAEHLADFKKSAASAKTAEDMWSIRSRLEQVQREIDRKYDYRYSQLINVFGQLLRERRVTEEQLAFLSEDKRGQVLRIAGR